MKNSIFWKAVKLTILLFAIIFLVPPKNSIVSQSEDDIDGLVNNILENMTPEEKIGQLFMVYWSETNQLPQGLLELIDTYKVGSVLISEVNFLNRNDLSTVELVANLTNDLQQYNWENNKISVNESQLFVPLFLAVDHEGDGARLTRIRDGMTPIPSQMAIGATWSPENAQAIGQIVGSELNAIGINMLLGPVLDVLDNVNNPQGNLDIRVFGGDPEWVGELGRAYIRGVHIGGQVIR